MVEFGTQLYEDLMRFRPDGLSPNAWAVKAGVSRTVWQDLRRHGNPSRRTLQKLLAAAGSSLAEFEALRVGRLSPVLEVAVIGGFGEAGREFHGAGLPPIPLLRSQPAGEWSPGVPQIAFDRKVTTDRLSRPVSLLNDPGAYALTIPDNAMWPRFRCGRPVVVSPAAVIELGDDVLAILAGMEKASSSRAMMKELTGRSVKSLQLRQFTPDMTFEIPLVQIATVHKVVGEWI